MSDDTRQTVLLAIQSLYGQDTSQQSVASVWLNSFSTTAEAWPIAVTLLDEPSLEARFFAANMLLSKVRRDGTRLTADQQSQLAAAVRHRIEGQPGQPIVLQRHLCLVLSTITVLHGDNAVAALLHDALRWADQGKVILSLDVLTALAEEIDALQPFRRKAVMPICVQMSSHVFSALGRLMAGMSQHAGQGGHNIPLLQCARVWLAFDLDGAGSTFVSPGSLMQSQPELFAGLLRAAKSCHDSVSGGATEILCNLLGHGVSSSTPELDLRALQEVCAAATSALAESMQQGEVEEHIAEAVVRMACAAAEREPEACTSSSEQAHALAEAVLLCLQHPSRSICETAIEYFEALSMVPVAERAPFFGQPLCRRLLQALLRQACYPADFVTWVECTNDDEDDFSRFRSNALKDALGLLYALLRADYLQECSRLATGPNSWQHKEVALYAMSAAAPEVRKRAMQAEVQATEELQQDALQSSAFLLSFFRSVCSVGEEHACLAQTLAACLGDYAAWFGRSPEAPFGAAMQRLLQCMAVPQAAEAAAVAFRNLCVRCTGRLQDSSVLGALIHALQGLLSQGNMGAKRSWRREVVEGLARAACNLPTDQASAAGLQIANLIVARLDSLASDLRPGAPAHVREDLSEQLGNLATLIRFLEGHGSLRPGATAIHPAIGVLETALPVLRRIMQSAELQADADLFAALCEVLERLLSVEDNVAAAVLPGTMAAVVQALQRHKHACGLNVISSALEAFHRDHTQQHVIQDAFSQACLAVAPLLQDQGMQNLQETQEEAAQEVREAMYTTADRYQLLAPSSFAATQMLGRLGQGIVPSLLSRETGPVRASLNFLSHALAPLTATEDVKKSLRAQLDAWLAGSGQQLVQALIYAALDTCPRQLLRMLAAPLRALLCDRAYGTAALGWLSHALTMPDMPGVRDGSIVNEDCMLFLAIATKKPPLPVPRFAALVTDFASIARNENTSDVLLAYDL